MRGKLLDFGHKNEKYIFLGVVGILLVLGSVLLYPFVKGHISIGNRYTGSVTAELSSEKTPEEYYKMFRCSCCGQPIDAGCCEMAEQRKEYLDEMLLGGIEEEEIVYRMVKQFGFDILMDSSKEQQVRDYIKSRAPNNPPIFEIENPVYNFGTVSQKQGITSTIFNIKNAGGSDLVIENIDASCMCTSASLIYNGEESPKFSMGMHGNNPKNFALRIPPGETAQLKVYYDPNAHGPQKEAETRIIREITVTSNDPVNFQKKVRVELIQTP